jgi:c(7)-type cytochrome triheme protein
MARRPRPPLKQSAVLGAAAVFGAAALSMAAAASQGEPPASQGPQQPVPYSHKTHLALGLECASCHSNPDPGESMGYPPESFCMTCHQAIKAESPHIQKLAAAAKETRPLPWVRVYRLKEYVYFSHRVHIQASTACETCHGPVRERDVIAPEVEHNMRSCIACHQAKKAREDCKACHEERG